MYKRQDEAAKDDVCVTFVAESHWAWRRLRSRTTSMAWERLRAGAIWGTLTSMLRGVVNVECVLVTPLTRLSLTTIGVALAAGESSDLFEPDDPPLQADSGRRTIIPAASARVSFRHEVTNDRVCHRLGRIDGNTAVQENLSNFFNASVTFMCRAAGVWRECRPAGCVPRSFRGSPEKILNIALATGGRANQASSRVSVRQVAASESGR